MYRKVLLAICIVPLLVGSAARADWRTDLDALLCAPSAEEQDRLLGGILEASPDWKEVVAFIESLSFPDREPGNFQVRRTTSVDGVERPWILYIPPQYSSARRSPLMVVLHGGVSRENVTEDPEAYAREHFFTPLAAEKGWLLLFPFGQTGATWWDEVGMSGIRNLLRRIKRELNVDDDRVWMAGFSDGASAAFLHAMADPTDYGAFVALNGHMGVGSLDGDLETYAPNMANTPVYAVTTGGDQLYATSTMRSTLEMAVSAGGDVLYRTQEGGHDFSYGEEELPLIARFLDRHPRDPFPVRILWETADRRFGACRWFAIDRVTIDEAASWHRDHNAILVDRRISIGFYVDDSYEGEGVRVERVVEEGALASEIGLEAGDVIVRCNETAIATMDDLNSFKAGAKRGDAVEIVVSREGEEAVLKGNFPEPLNHFVFKRLIPSALARVRACGNRIHVETSRVGAFRIKVHPDMIRLEDNLVITVDGVVAFDGPPSVNLEYLLRNFLENRDRRLLYVAEISIEPLRHGGD